MSIYESILKAEKEGRCCALATVVNTVGCAPRSAGTKMLIYSDGAIEGTVGGGLAEQLVIKDARACMQSGQTLLKRYSPQVIAEHDLEPDCIKTMDIFIEPMGYSTNLYLLGSGHVAQAVLPLAKQAGFYVTVVDTRDVSGFADALRDADEIVPPSDVREFAEKNGIPVLWAAGADHQYTNPGGIQTVLAYTTQVMGESK